MLSTKIAKIIPMLLLFVSAAFATAPGWVAKGVVLEYDMDGDTVTFTVTDRTSSEVEFDIKTKKTFKATENASGLYGQFWFDESKLKSASKGHHIDEFEVTGTSSQTFAGKKWDTVTLVGTISGARTTRIYDKDSGLMLKQTVMVADAPAVTLEEYTIPDFGASAPPPPPPTQPAQPADETAQPSGPANGTAQPTAPSEPATPEPEEGIGQPVDSADSSPAVATPDEGEPDASAKKSCLPGAVLLMLAGFVFFRS